MCGRYLQGEASLNSIAQFAGSHREAISPNVKVKPNFGPGMKSVIVTASSEGNGARKLVEAQWGLCPSWQAKQKGFKPNFYAMFNARSESAFDKPSFKNLINRRIEVDRKHLISTVSDEFKGFYEWHMHNKKQPYFVYVKGGPCLVAGLYETCHYSNDNGSNVLTTYTMMTTSACTSFSSIHTRQPVLLTPEQASDWLHNPACNTFDYLNVLQESQRGAKGLLQNCGWHAVTPKIGNIKYQESDCSVEWQKPLSFVPVSKIESPSKTQPITKDEVVSQSVSALSQESAASTPKYLKSPSKGSYTNGSIKSFFTTDVSSPLKKKSSARNYSNENNNIYISESTRSQSAAQSRSKDISSNPFFTKFIPAEESTDRKINTKKHLRDEKVVSSSISTAMAEAEEEFMKAEANRTLQLRSNGDVTNPCKRQRVGNVCNEGVVVVNLCLDD